MLMALPWMYSATVFSSTECCGVSSSCPPKILAIKFLRRCDMAVVLCMLAGAKPFNGKSADDLDRAVLRTAPKFPKEVFSPGAIAFVRLLSGNSPGRHVA